MKVYIIVDPEDCSIYDSCAYATHDQAKSAGDTKWGNYWSAQRAVKELEVEGPIPELEALRARVKELERSGPQGLQFGL